MKIAVNTRLLQFGKLQGIGWFINETLKRITVNNPQVEFILIFDRKPKNLPEFSKNVTYRVLYPPTRHPLLWYTWFDWSLPPLLKKINPDLFLSPDGYISLNTNIPQLAVIHDINFMHRPKDLPLLSGHYYRHYFPKFAVKAMRIATVSEYSKNDICSSFSIPGNKIDVVYNGVNENFSPVSEQVKKAWRMEHTGGFDYFIYVGYLHPRKNIENMLLAFENFKKTDSSGIKLVIVGEPMFKTSNIYITLRKLTFKSDVLFKGRLMPEFLNIAIGSAQALLLVSHFEGFGIPVLEAFKCHVPVICSNTTSLPEVAGDSALLVDPNSIQLISNAMYRVVNENNLRDQLIQRGKVRAEMFNWNRTSELLWKSIEKTIQSVH